MGKYKYVCNAYYDGDEKVQDHIATDDADELEIWIKRCAERGYDKIVCTIRPKEGKRI